MVRRSFEHIKFFLQTVIFLLEESEGEAFWLEVLKAYICEINLQRFTLHKYKIPIS